MGLDGVSYSLISILCAFSMLHYVNMLLQLILALTTSYYNIDTLEFGFSCWKIYRPQI